MSRTYRRKPVTDPQHWIYSYWTYTCGETLIYRLKKEYIKPQSKEGKKALAKYRSDSTKTMDGGVPKAFVREYCTKPLRAAEKRALHKVMKGEEDILFPLYIKHALWEYW